MLIKELVLLSFFYSVLIVKHLNSTNACLHGKNTPKNINSTAFYNIFYWKSQ